MPAENGTSSINRPAPANGTLGKVIYIIRELGVATALIAFVCYLLAVQMPAARDDFRTQTEKIVKAVETNNLVIGQLTEVLRELRRARPPENE